jgi:hypothetical protein
MPYFLGSALLVMGSSNIPDGLNKAEIVRQKQLLSISIKCVVFLATKPEDF